MASINGAYWRMSMVARLLGVIAVACLISCSRSNEKTNGSTTGRFDFYGKVVDQDGKPLAGATIKLRYGEHPKVAAMIADPPPQTDLTLTSGVDGRFELKGAAGNQLMVLEVTKLGYEWLYDYGANWMTEPSHDNRYLLFLQGGQYSFNIPDAELPAIYPLIQLGSDHLYPLSRGGKERLQGGTIVVNEPFTPEWPTAGPNAARTPKELNAQILKRNQDLQAKAVQAIRDEEHARVDAAVRAATQRSSSNSTQPTTQQ
ncbi:MAG: carboxypeptidase-like regulatory domain-containing protein [Tepidisphaeraceae bacterium]